ncbi:MAG: UDP-N-acetyl-D-glucosamine dehydrogenase, partial [Gaiellaceae bacterium]|nr:UDP-N-acetyl-D-glucosamine dehydrogenase [Gaiellaceae bacterium]
LMLGVSYKADIDDVRESPAEKIIRLLHAAGAEVSYHDPHVPEFDGMSSVAYAPEDYDCVVIVTAHTAIDYEDLVERAAVIVDFRNATGGVGSKSEKVWKL